MCVTQLYLSSISLKSVETVAAKSLENADLLWRFMSFINISRSRRKFATYYEKVFCQYSILLTISGLLFSRTFFNEKSVKNLTVEELVGTPCFGCMDLTQLMVWFVLKPHVNIWNCIIWNRNCLFINFAICRGIKSLPF